MATRETVGVQSGAVCPPGPYGMPCDRPPEWWQSDLANYDTTAYWRDLLVTSAVTAFEWSNLPDGIDSRWIEMTLLFNGMGGFFEKIPGQLAFSSGAVVGRYDMYMNPEEVNFVSSNGTGTWTRRTRERITRDDSGEITIEPITATWGYDNSLRIPLFWHIQNAAQRLGRFDRLIDINTAAQATPWIAEATEESRQDIVNFSKQVTGFEPLVVVGNNFFTDGSNLHLFNTDAPFVVDKLQDARTRELNLIYTLLGIDNQFSTKREREVSAEIDSNNEQIMILRQSRLQYRQKLAEETNELFGTDISIRWSVAHDMNGDVDMGDDSTEGVRFDGVQ